MNIGVQSIGLCSEFLYGNHPIEMPVYYARNLYSTYSITKNIRTFVDHKNITDEKYSEARGYNSRRFNFMAEFILNF